jgi:spermidine/putrescine transport system substrate-binding protein
MTLLDQFHAECPWITVEYNTFGSNEEMYTMLKSGKQCDLCIPSDYMIERMISENMLEKIDLSNVPSSSNILPSCKSKDFDPNNDYSIPYMWGTVGILYNSDMVTAPVDSWNILWDSKYSKQILMYDSSRDSIAVGLLKTGHDINTRSDSDLKDALDALIEQKPLVLAYLGDDIRDTMISGSAALAVVYSGDALLAMQGNDKLKYVVPKEGSNVWFDSMVVLKGSQHKNEAELFMDFMNRPDVAKKNCEYIGYSTPNAGALALMGDDKKNDPVFNPPADVVSRCVVYRDLGSDLTKKYLELWEQLKAK